MTENNDMSWTAALAVPTETRCVNAREGECLRTTFTDEETSASMDEEAIEGARLLEILPRASLPTYLSSARFQGHSHSLSAPAFSFQSIPNPLYSPSYRRPRAFTDSLLSRNAASSSHVSTSSTQPASLCSSSFARSDLPSLFGPNRKSAGRLLGHRRVFSAAATLDNSMPSVAESNPTESKQQPSGRLTEVSGNLWDLKDPPGGLNDRPSYAYVTLIRYAILGAPSKRLTLQEIYEAIEKRYSYFLTAGKGWRNSVRHNLSLNKCFKKQGRHILDPGKGNYVRAHLSISLASSIPYAVPKWTVDVEEELCTARHRNRKSKHKATQSLSDLPPAGHIQRRENLSLPLDQEHKCSASHSFSLSSLTTEDEIRSWFATSSKGVGEDAYDSSDTHAQQTATKQGNEAPNLPVENAQTSGSASTLFNQPRTLGGWRFPAGGSAANPTQVQEMYDRSSANTDAAISPIFGDQQMPRCATYSGIPDSQPENMPPRMHSILSMRMSKYELPVSTA